MCKAYPDEKLAGQEKTHTNAEKCHLKERHAQDDGLACVWMYVCECEEVD